VTVLELPSLELTLLITEDSIVTFLLLVTLPLASMGEFVLMVLENLILLAIVLPLYL